MFRDSVPDEFQLEFELGRSRPTEFQLELIDLLSASRGVGRDNWSLPLERTVAGLSYEDGRQTLRPKWNVGAFRDLLHSRSPNVPIETVASSAYNLNRLPNRAEVAKMVVTALGIAPEVSPPKHLLFSDVEPGASYWAAPYIYALRVRGVLEGFPDGTYQPNAELTQEHALNLVDKAGAAKDGGEANKLARETTPVPEPGPEKIRVQIPQSSGRTAWTTPDINNLRRDVGIRGLETLR